MQIFEELNENKGLSLAFGFFDGIHLGHQAVVKKAVDFAHEYDTKTAVITFQDHPCCFFYNLEPKYIISKQDKIEILEKLGVDYLYFIKFDEYLAMMDASDYLRDVIIKNFSPMAISTGFNHYFGAQKSGDVKLLCTMQNEYCYQYFEVPPVLFNNEIISSTRIRECLSLGQIELANAMLGYNYFLKETVVEGARLGTRLGFKTANLIYPDNLVEIDKGVYKVTVEYGDKIHNGVANYGFRPTVTRTGKQLLEVHILDFDKDIYGEKIKVNFIKKIRDEKKFDSIDELQEQIRRDVEDATKL